MTSKLKSKELFNLFIFFIFILAPGPGSYKLFSEFGQYQSKNADDPCFNSPISPKGEIKEEEN